VVARKIKEKEGERVIEVVMELDKWTELAPCQRWPATELLPSILYDFCSSRVTVTTADISC